MEYKRLFIKNKRKYVLVDSYIYPLIKSIGWYIHHTGYAYAKFGQKNVQLHRIITMAPSDLCVDHKNQNKLDNRFDNLRLCHKGHNSFNMPRQKNNTSGFKGVSYHKHNKTWVAYVGKRSKGDGCYIGSFKTKKEAAQAYNQEAKKRYGKFAHLNNMES